RVGVARERLGPVPRGACRRRRVVVFADGSRPAGVHDGCAPGAGRGRRRGGARRGRSDASRRRRDPRPVCRAGRPPVPADGGTVTSRVALYLQDKHPIRDGMRYAKLAEAAGFEAVWQAESRLVREATVPMAAYAAVTDRSKVGSGGVNNWTRNVGRLAATFWTLDDLAPGL